MGYFLEIKGTFFLLFTSRFPSSPDSKDTKMLSVLNKRFLFVSLRVTERLSWQLLWIQAYIWVATLNKRYPSLSTTTQHNPPVSLIFYLEGMVETRNPPVTIKKLFWVPPSVAWWLENRTRDTYRCSPPRSRNMLAPFLQRANHWAPSSTLLGESSRESAHRSTIRSRPLHGWRMHTGHPAASPGSARHLRPHAHTLLRPTAPRGAAATTL